MSDAYATVHSDGYKYLLYCKVFIGRSVVGNNCDITMPNDVNGNEYDSLVDKLHQPSLYVVIYYVIVYVYLQQTPCGI